MACRLFQRRPNEIFEHPPGMSTKISEIPAGPIEGWLCHAGCFHDNEVFEFTADVCIDDNNRRYVAIGGSYYWYDEDTDATNFGRPQVPCWYQSGKTLRFTEVRK